MNPQRLAVGDAALKITEENKENKYLSCEMLKCRACRWGLLPLYNPVVCLAVSVEKVDLKGLSHTQSDRNVDCSFEVRGSPSQGWEGHAGPAEVLSWVAWQTRLRARGSLPAQVPVAGPRVRAAEESWQ